MVPDQFGAIILKIMGIILSWLATPERYMGTVPTIEVVFEHGCMSEIGGPTTTRTSRNPRKCSQLGE